MADARETIMRIAEVAEAIGFQAGVGASETAGLIISVLSRRPELIDRFMVEGSELFIEGHMRASNGRLTYHDRSGTVQTPEFLHRVEIINSLRRLSTDRGGERDDG